MNQSPQWAPLPSAKGPEPSLDEEERAMKSGRGKMIAFAVLVLVGVVALIGFLMVSGGSSAYGQVGRQVNGLRTGNFDAFWMCALPRANYRTIENNQQLGDEVHERAAFNAAQYAQLVRTTCLVHLQDHVAPLDQLLPPDDLRPSVDALRAALRSLIDAWTAYLSYLNTAETYDRESEQAVSLVRAIVRGWFDYKVAHQQVNDVIRTHVTE